VPEIGPQSLPCASFPVAQSLKRLGYWLDGPVFESRQGRGFLVSKMFSPTLRATQLFIEWVPGFFTGVKRPWREVNQSPPSGSAVQNEWSYTSVSPVCLHGVGRENFTFTFTQSSYDSSL